MADSVGFEEWVSDDWHLSYEGAPSDGRVWCGNSGDCTANRAYSRVTRGGNFSFGAEYLRSSSRNWALADTLNFDHFNVGIRCCR